MFYAPIHICFTLSKLNFGIAKHICFANQRLMYYLGKMRSGQIEQCGEGLCNRIIGSYTYNKVKTEVELKIFLNSILNY